MSERVAAEVGNRAEKDIKKKEKNGETPRGNGE